MKSIRRLYDWVLHWSDTPYAVPALIILSFAESSFFPIPPDVLLVGLALGKPKRAFQFALICTIGSVTGGLFGYLIGFHFWNFTGPFFLKYIFSESLFIKVQELYTQYDFTAIFVSGFTPIPYKVFTIAAGVFKINVMTFFLASICGRALRFFLVAAFIFFLGNRVKQFMDKYFNIVTIAFTILLIGGFIFVKWIAEH